MSSPPWAAFRSSRKGSRICPGYNVRCVLVIHTPAQLREIYGAHAAETMLKSLAARIVFAAKDHSDAREISDELGFTTVRVKTVSTPLFGFGNAKGQRARSQNVSEQRRALLLPQEVKALGADEAILFYEGLPPIRARKLRYFEDRRFTARLLPPPAEAAPRGSRAGEPAAVPESTADSPAVPAATESSPREAATPPMVREATVDDIDRLESLTLEDFDVDLKNVKIPEKPAGERLSSDELNAAVDSFLESLKTR